MGSFAIEICIVTLLLPYLAILLGIFFDGTPFVEGSLLFIQHLPFADFFTKLLQTSFTPEQFLDVTFFVFFNEFLTAIFMGCVLYICKGIIRITSLQRLPLIRTTLNFAILLIGGIFLKWFNAMNDLGAVLSELGSIIVMLIGMAILSRSVFSKNALFTRGNLSKGILCVIIDSILAIILTAYMSMLNLCLIHGFSTLFINFKNFICVTIITAIAIGIVESINHAFDKDVER